MTKQKKHNKSFILRLLILGVCIYMTVTLTGLWKDLNEKQAQRDSLVAKQNALINDIEEYRVMLSAESNSQIIEKAARERLGYIRLDEEVFKDPSGD